MKKITAINLFAGCGGEGLGFELTGLNIDNPIDFIKSKVAPEGYKEQLEVIGFAEFWKPAIAAHQLNFPDCPLIGSGDVTKIDEWDLEPFINKVDILSGGFPCQSFSSAGLQKGLFDDRGQLYKQFVRIANILKPKYIIGENVKNIENFNDQCDITVPDLICKAFKEIGYTMRYKILCAADYGVPQMRYRMIFIGSCDTEKYPIKFPEPKYGTQDFIDLNGLRHNKYVTVKDVIGDIEEITGRNGHNEIKLSDKQRQIWELLKEGQNINSISDIDIKRIGVVVYNHGYIRTNSNMPSHTIIKSDSSFHYNIPRQLSIREAARLSSFPDWFQFPNKQGKQQVGNAIPPLFAKAIVEELVPYLK